jgi:hypothetical protein
MSDLIWTGAAVLALLSWPLVPVLDALRRPDRAPAPFQVLAPVQTGCAGGVPYVIGTPDTTKDVR